MTRTANRPSHRVYAVTKNGTRSFWNPIGAAWEHADGEGFAIKLDYLPINGAEKVPVHNSTLMHAILLRCFIRAFFVHKSSA